jgi:hypothetical protein
MKISAKASCRTGHKAQRPHESGSTLLSSHPRVYRIPRRNPLPSRILIANDNCARIVIPPVLRNEGSDRRESRDLSFRSPRCHQRPQILIANPELEFHLTACRTNHMQISNRKFVAFFRSIPRSALLTACSSTHVVLIYGGAIRIRRNTLKRCGIKISNRRQTGG